MRIIAEISRHTLSDFVWIHPAFATKGKDFFVAITESSTNNFDIITKRRRG